MSRLFRLSVNEYGKEYKNHLIEQYKIYVEMADRISQFDKCSVLSLISFSLSYMVNYLLFDIIRKK